MNTLPLPVVEEISIDELMSALPAHYRLDLAFLRMLDRCRGVVDEVCEPLHRRQHGADVAQ